MAILVFDTETNGFGGDARVIQLAWARFGVEGEVQATFCELIRPDGWEIPEKKFWIEHGYSTQGNAERGVGIEFALGQLVESINVSSVMVAHNLNFDQRILFAEMKRAGLRAGHKPEKVCTMSDAKALCKLQRKGGGLKEPKLVELHEFLFGEGFDGAHDAMADVMATGRCYFELKRRGFYL